MMQVMQLLLPHYQLLPSRKMMLILHLIEGSSVLRMHLMHPRNHTMLQYLHLMYSLRLLVTNITNLLLLLRLMLLLLLMLFLLLLHSPPPPHALIIVEEMTFVHPHFTHVHPRN